MKKIENKTFDQERALYGTRDVYAQNCSFDGPADGESAFKECKNITADSCRFHLRYPFWHDDNLKLKNCEMFDTCRAALWYSKNIEIFNTKLHGIKAMRECSSIAMHKCDIVSSEFGWSLKNLTMSDCKAVGEYMFMHSKNLKFSNFEMSGKYSFQYICHAKFENCTLDTKDAFWHAKNVYVKNCTVKGEYLAWYCKNVTFENCTIIGTQPFCYCQNLVLKNCKMIECDLAFEKSSVRADISSSVISIKNPRSGYIKVPSVLEIIKDDEKSRAKIYVSGKEYTAK